MLHLALHLLVVPAQHRRDQLGRRAGALDATVHAIETALATCPYVVGCYLVSGEADFMAQVVVPDLTAYERVLLGELLAVPRVTDARSTFAIRTILDRGPLPLDHWT